MSAFARKVRPVKEGSSASLSRNHVIEISESGLVSLMGGKWTSYRQCGVDCVDAILNTVPEGFLKPKHESTKTEDIKFLGSYSKSEFSTGIVMPP